jgi:hypothetical protein
MKLATTAGPRLLLPVWPHPTAVALSYRLAGLVIAVSVPVLFWALAVLLAAKAMGLAAAAPALLAGLIVAVWCLPVAALVMDNRR